ncbi:MAG: hypothetical protein LBH50_01025 [Spirochaetaceae bacterium]|jgi:hypothetical protein|nr:hypothetical protein [Spirochaetaceae bacterium]
MNAEQMAEAGKSPDLEKLKAEILESEAKIKRLFAEASQKHAEIVETQKKTEELIRQTAEERKKPRS